MLVPRYKNDRDLEPPHLDFLEWSMVQHQDLFPEGTPYFASKNQSDARSVIEHDLVVEGLLSSSTEQKHRSGIHFSYLQFVKAALCRHI